MVAAGFLRLATNPKVFVVPTPGEAGVKFMDSILATPGVVISELGREWPTRSSDRHDLTFPDVGVT